MVVVRHKLMLLPRPIELVIEFIDLLLVADLELLFLLLEDDLQLVLLLLQFEPLLLLDDVQVALAGEALLSLFAVAGLDVLLVLDHPVVIPHQLFIAFSQGLVLRLKFSHLLAKLSLLPALLFLLALHPLIRLPYLILKRSYPLSIVFLILLDESLVYDFDIIHFRVNIINRCSALNKAVHVNIKRI